LFVSARMRRNGGRAVTGVPTMAGFARSVRLPRRSSDATREF
jgi:hypothetical protein